MFRLPQRLRETTALKLVNRLLTLSGGEILVEGRDAKNWDVIKLRRHIGYAIQDVGLFPHYTVDRNIGLILSSVGTKEKFMHGSKSYSAWLD